MYEIYKEFSKEATTEPEVLWRVTDHDTSREDMKRILETWKKELHLNPGDYKIFNKLDNIATGMDWPHGDEPFEDTEQSRCRRNFFYFNVSRSNTDVDKFSIVICHLTTNVVGVSLSMLIGELCKKGFVYREDDNIYLKFEMEDSEAAA